MLGLISKKLNIALSIIGSVVTAGLVTLLVIFSAKYKHLREEVKDLQYTVTDQKIDIRLLDIEAIRHKDYGFFNQIVEQEGKNRLRDLVIDKYACNFHNRK